MTKNEENQNDGFRVFSNKKESKCQQMLVSFFMSVAIVKKYLSQTQATAVFTAHTEQFPALLFRKIKVVVSYF